MNLLRNVAARVTLRHLINPAASAAATINGAAVDRFTIQNPLSVLLRQATGAATGTPSTISVITRLQHSDDGSTGWANFGDACPDVTAVNTASEVAIDLSGCKRFVRAQTVVAFTGGSTPTVVVAAAGAFGGGERLPMP